MTREYTNDNVYEAVQKRLTTKDIPSWKRMCYCILRNDHTCRFMGFNLTREQQKRVDLLKTKYSKVGEENGI